MFKILLCFTLIIGLCSSEALPDNGGKEVPTGTADSKPSDSNLAGGEPVTKPKPTEEKDTDGNDDDDSDSDDSNDTSEEDAKSPKYYSDSYEYSDSDSYEYYYKH